MARSSLDLVDPRIAKALSHPMRARILMILDERVASPNEIAETIDERLPNVSYHVRALLDTMIRDVEKVAADSAKRLKRAGEEGIATTVVAMQFELPATHDQES